MNQPTIIKELQECCIIKKPQAGHCIEHWQLLLLQDGIIKLTAGDQLYTLKAGDAALLAPRTLHLMNPQGEMQGLLLTFKGEISVLSPFANHAFNLSKEISLIHRLSDSIAAKESLKQRQVAPLAELLLLLCLQTHPLTADDANQEAALFQKAIAIMEEAIPRPLSLDTLSQQLDISLSHLKRVFARFSGIGAHEYFTELRLKRAKELLEKGSSVTETAVLAGFANQAYFSAAFKKCTGCSPKEFLIKNPSQKKTRTKATAQIKETRKPDMPSYLL